MSEISRLSGSGNSSVFPGHTIYPFRCRDYGEAESILEARNLEVAAMAARRLPPDEARQVRQEAREANESGHYRFDMSGFRAAVFSQSDFPLFLRLSLREPALLDEQVEELYKALPPEQRGQVQMAVLEAVGYDLSPRKTEDKPKNEVAPQSVGAISSDSASKPEAPPSESVPT